MRAFHIRLEESTWEAVLAMAVRRDEPVALLIRRLIKQGLAGEAAAGNAVAREFGYRMREVPRFELGLLCFRWDCNDTVSVACLEESVGKQRNQSTVDHLRRYRDEGWQLSA
jgi:hypothetical protein